MKTRIFKPYLSAADAKRKVLDDEILAELEEWSMKIEEVRKALIEWENLSADQKNSVEYEVRLRELRDQLSNLEGYYRKGKEEGFQEGLKIGRQLGIPKEIMEARKEVALEMLKEGLDVEFIAKVTKLNINEIEELEKSL